MSRYGTHQFPVGVPAEPANSDQMNHAQDRSCSFDLSPTETQSSRHQSCAESVGWTRTVLQKDAPLVSGAASRTTVDTEPPIGDSRDDRMEDETGCGEAIAMRILALSVLAVLVSTSSGFAQFRQQAPEKAGFGVTADLIFAQMGGSVGDSVGTGFGGLGSAFFQPGGTPARLGAGISYTRFSTEGSGDALRKLSIFALAGLQMVDAETSVIPYLQGTVGYTRLSDDQACSEFICGVNNTLRGQVRTGIELGANVGVDIPMTENLNIDVAGTFSWLGLGDLEVDGQMFDGFSANGSIFGLRAGITYFPR